MKKFVTRHEISNEVQCGIQADGWTIYGGKVDKIVCFGQKAQRKNDGALHITPELTCPLGPFPGSFMPEKKYGRQAPVPCSAEDFTTSP